MSAITVQELSKTFTFVQKPHGFAARVASLWRPRKQIVQAVRTVSF